jgi:hypothetical protein
MDGAVISKASGTNAGDTAATSVELVLGNRYGGTFEGSINKYSEFVLFEGTVSTGDRDAVEASQKTYFLKRKRLVFFGDSLVYGANLGGTDPRIRGEHQRPCARAFGRRLRRLQPRR